MNEKQDLPVISFACWEDWERWLAEHYASSDGLWLKIAKRGSDVASISYAEALEAALCYGWVDLEPFMSILSSLIRQVYRARVHGGLDLSGGPAPNYNQKEI